MNEKGGMNKGRRRERRREVEKRNRKIVRMKETKGKIGRKT